MDARQYSHIARSSALEALFSTRPETSSITGLPETLALFSAQLDLVETLVKRQTQPLDLVLHARDAAFEAMKIATLIVAGKVSAFAVRTQRSSLALNVQVKASDLERPRFVERVRSCQRIHDAVVKELSAVAASGVTTAMLEDLQTKIHLARDFLTASRTTVVDKSTATVQLAEAIRELNAIISKQIEPLVAPCEFTHREFFLMYCAARKIIAPSRARAEEAPEAVSDALVDAVPIVADTLAASASTTSETAVSSTAAVVSTPSASPVVPEVPELKPVEPASLEKPRAHVSADVDVVFSRRARKVSAMSGPPGMKADSWKGAWRAGRFARGVGRHAFLP